MRTELGVCWSGHDCLCSIARCIQIARGETGMIVLGLSRYMTEIGLIRYCISIEMWKNCVVRTWRSRHHIVVSRCIASPRAILHVPMDATNESFWLCDRCNTEKEEQLDTDAIDSRLINRPFVRVAYSRQTNLVATATPRQPFAMLGHFVVAFVWFVERK